MVAKKINQNLSTAIEFIANNREKFVQNPCSDFTRIRKLSLQDTIKQILAMEGGSLKKELYHFAQVHKTNLTDSALVQQRSKIKSCAFYDVFRKFNKFCKDEKKHHGYKLLAVDGSDINRYRNPNSDSFIRSKFYPDGYNQIHLNALYDILNNTYVDAILQGKNVCNEHDALIKMCDRINFPDRAIVIADRGYESFNNIAYFVKNHQFDLVLRVRHENGGIREIRELPMKTLDVDLKIGITTRQTNDDKKAGRHYIPTGSKKGKKLSPNTKVHRWDFESPCDLQFRAVRFPLETGKYETLITTLSRDEFSFYDLKELYHMRWSIETSFCALKYKVGLINLHCKKDDLIVQEIYAALTMYNYCSRIAANASVRQRKGAIYEYQVNFTMAIHLCKLYYKWHKTNLRQLLAEIGQYAEPVRLGRSDKRNVKAKRFVGFSYRVAA